MNDYDLTSFVQKPVCFACGELNSRTRKEMCIRDSPVLGAMGMKGMACLPISKQLDPVSGVDIHLVTIPPSPVVPMPHPYVGATLYLIGITSVSLPP